MMYAHTFINQEFLNIEYLYKVMISRWNIKINIDALLIGTA